MTASPPNRRSPLRLLLRIVVSGTFIGFLLTRVEWSELREVAAGLRPLWFLPIFAGMLFTTLLSSVKWSLFLRADGVHVPLLRLTAAYIISTFFSCFLPSSIGGDIYRVYSVGRTAGTSRSLAAVMMGRLTGFFTLASIGLVAALLNRDRLGDPAVVWSIAVVLLFIVAAFVAVSSRRALGIGKAVLGAIGLQRFAGFAERVQESILRYRAQPGVLLASLGVSVIQQLTVLTCIYLLSRALAIETWFVYFLSFIPVIEALAAIPVSIFGIGVRDSGYAFFFGAVGLTEAQCLSLSLLYVTVTLVYASLGGLLYLGGYGDAGDDAVSGA